MLLAPGGGGGGGGGGGVTVGQSVASPTADPGITSLISARSYTYVEIGHEMISMFILLLPLIEEGLLSVTSESMCRKYWVTP